MLIIDIINDENLDLEEDKSLPVMWINQYNHFKLQKNIKEIAWLYSRRERTTKEESYGCEGIDFFARGMES